MEEKKRRVVKKIQFFAPYHQCEAAVHASAMASFVLRKLKDIRVYRVQYCTTDTLSDYCSPFVDPYVYRVVSPNDFAFHSDGTKAVYWFVNQWDFLRKSVGNCHRKNYLFGDFAKWDNEHIRRSRHYDSTLFPCDATTDRMKTLIGCFDNKTVYPMRCDLIDRTRMSVLLSMCSIQRPENRLSILSNIERTLQSRNDIFITLLMDGRAFKDERQYVERMGMEYSDRCVILNNFSDYEYMNILNQCDLFLDLNPINGVGYFLSAALNRGLLVGGYSQPLYRDILCEGEYGLLFNGERREYGYGFDHVIPHWDRLFKKFNERVFNVQNLIRWMDYRNSRPNFQTTMEARAKSLLGMFMYLTNAKIKSGSIVSV
jgi:hypothetical protein